MHRNPLMLLKRSKRGIAQHIGRGCFAIFGNKILAQPSSATGFEDGLRFSVSYDVTEWGFTSMSTGAIGWSVKINDVDRNVSAATTVANTVTVTYDGPAVIATDTITVSMDNTACDLSLSSGSVRAASLVDYNVVNGV